MNRPRIFVSAVSGELGSARQLVANTLSSLGYEPIWQDVFSTEQGDLRGVLCRKIDSCQGVVQLVGQRYGFEPPERDERFGRVSYTQYEALYAQSRERKVWRVLLAADFPSDALRDAREAETSELAEIQRRYRAQIEQASDLYYVSSQEAELKSQVLQLRDDLAKLRRGVRRWMVGVGVALALIVILTVVVVTRQSQTQETVEETQRAVDEIRELRLAEIDDLRRKLQEALDEQRLTESAIARIGIEAARAAATNPEIEALADELVALIDAFGSKFDERELSEADSERLAFARAVERNAEGRYDEALELVTLEMAEREDRVAEAQAERAFQANVIRGVALFGRSQYREALTHLRRAERWKPDDLSNLWSLGFCLWRLKEHREALSLLDRVVHGYSRLVERDGREEPDLARSHNNRGIIYHALGRYEETLADYEKAIAILTPLVDVEGRVELATDLASSHHNRGDTYDALVRYEEALADYGKAIAILTRLVDVEGRAELATDLASSHYSRGNTYDALGRYEEELADYEKVITIWTRLVDVEGRAELANDLASSHYNRGNTYRALGRYEEALVDYEKAIAIRTRLIDVEGRAELANNLAASHHNRGIIYNALGRYEEALVDYEKAIAILTRLVDVEGRAELATDLASSHYSRGYTYDALGRYEEALADYEKAIAIRTRLVDVEGRVELATDLASSHYNRGIIYNALGRYEEALVDYEKAIAIRTRLVDVERRAELANDLASSLVAHAWVCLEIDDHVAAAADLVRARAILHAASTPITPLRDRLLRAVESGLEYLDDEQ